MLLYTAIEHPSASWGKIHMGSPQFNRLTDRQTRLKTLSSRTLRMRAVTRETEHLREELDPKIEKVPLLEIWYRHF